MQLYLDTAADRSHPMWVRGLKLLAVGIEHFVVESHPMWVRGLKHLGEEATATLEGRTLCGCVD